MFMRYRASSHVHETWIDQCVKDDDVIVVIELISPSPAFPSEFYYRNERSQPSVHKVIGKEHRQ